MIFLFLKDPEEQPQISKGAGGAGGYQAILFPLNQTGGAYPNFNCLRKKVRLPFFFNWQQPKTQLKCLWRVVIWDQSSVKCIIFNQPDFYFEWNWVNLVREVGSVILCLYHYLFKDNPTTPTINPTIFIYSCRFGRMDLWIL